MYRTYKFLNWTSASIALLILMSTSPSYGTTTSGMTNAETILKTIETDVAKIVQATKSGSCTVAKFDLQNAKTLLKFQQTLLEEAGLFATAEALIQRGWTSGVGTCWSAADSAQTQEIVSLAIKAKEQASSGECDVAKQTIQKLIGMNVSGSTGESTALSSAQEAVGSSIAYVYEKCQSPDASEGTAETEEATETGTAKTEVPEEIFWKPDQIAASGWTDEQVAQAQEAAMQDAFDKFIEVKGAGSTILLQDMVNSYKDGNGSVFKDYKITTYDDFVNAFEDSGEPFTRYINRMGKYWYGAGRVELSLSDIPDGATGTGTATNTGTNTSKATSSGTTAGVKRMGGGAPAAASTATQRTSKASSGIQTPSTNKAPTTQTATNKNGDYIEWKPDQIAASGWTSQQIAQAQETAMEEAYEKFIAVKGAGSTIQLQDMVNSYTENAIGRDGRTGGSTFKNYKITTYDDFKNAFEDSGEPFTRYINRMGKYWYGNSRVRLYQPE